MLDSTQAMFVAWGPARILLYNDAHARLLGARHPAALGRPLAASWDDPQLALGVERALAGEPSRMDETELVLPTGGADQLRIRLSCSPIANDAGAGVDGVFCVASTVREQVEEVGSEQQLRASERRLGLAFDLAQAAAWEVNLQTGKLVVGERFFALTRMPPEAQTDVLQEWVELVVADDRARAVAEFSAACEPGAPAYDSEYRVRRMDGVVRWYASHGARIRDRDGVERMVGFIQDVTERKLAQLSLRESRAQLAAALASTTDAIVITDAEGNFLEFNEAFATFHRFANKRECGLRVADYPEVLEVFWTDGTPALVDQWAIPRALRGETLSSAEYLLRRSDTGETWVGSYSLGPIRDEHGAIVGSVVVGRDVTEAKQAEQALRAANEQLEQADRRKNEFIAVLSHELRNPLTPIRNSIYILERAGHDTDQAKRAREVIDRQTQHMTRLVEDLLDVTRISRAKVRLRRERVDLNALVRRTAEDHCEAYASGGVELEVQGPNQPVHVYGDPTRLAQVIGNLLNNSAKFTPRGGNTVVIVEANADNQAVVRIRDSGVGLAPETLAQIFEPFTQAAQTLARSRGGLGLGLALVKGLVELHGGKVEARSEGEGRGCEFSFTLPLASAAEVQTMDSVRADRCSSARRILVVEDNRDAAQSLRALLELDGHEVAVAYDGPDGLALARSFEPDVVLCDIGLPGLNGYEVARALRGDPKLSSMVLIALSGYTLAQDIERSKDAGFDRHMAKPPNLEALAQALALV